jgi:DGQHR domain-containing protein
VPTSDGAGAGTLKIKAGSVKAGAVVDGQHRLYGIAKFDPKVPVAVVGIVDADAVERAFQFLVINNKASKVPATHTKALLAKMSNTTLPERLKTAKLAFDADGIRDIDLVNQDKDSPFYQSIDWTTTPREKRMVPATAIELALDYLGGLGIAEFEDRDTRRSVFLTVWKAIKGEWGPLWIDKSRLISKVGIVCLTRFILDLITSWADNDELEINLTDLDDIKQQTLKIINHMDRKFWTTPWAEKAPGGFDTTQGRDRVLAALVQLHRNGRKDIPWYTDIDIIDRAGAKR